MHLVDNQKGFTLVELTVSILISTIILFFVTSMLLSASNLFVSNKESSENQQIGDAVYSYIVDQLTYGKHLQIFTDEASSVGNSTGGYTLTVTDGALYVQGENVFGDDFYMGRTMQFTASVYNGFYVNLVVTVLDKAGNEVYTSNSTVDALNMRAGNIIIDDQASGSPNPYITYDRQGD